MKIILNYFQLFNIEESFDVDLNNLSQAYQTLQKAVHPDRFAHASSQEQLIAVQKSALINDAYQTLKGALKRAEYMLTLRDIDIPNEQTTFSDTAFLMAQMELREMLADIRGSVNVDHAFNEAQQTLATEFSQLLTVMHEQLDENSTGANQDACDNLRKLKFYQKLNIELEKIEEQIFDD